MKKLLFVLSICLFLNCKKEYPDCDFHDDCLVNEACSKKTNQCITLLLPGDLPRFVPGSMMSPCFKWNNSESGKPILAERENEYCISGFEVATQCNNGTWTMLCKEFPEE